ncbi:hypothetical protein H2203_002696 [Taxawa tesnikishii (nom. ined.)]|nr:hypothetical protein H2203_002696 [Dothideales sp. JES 119]
MSLLYYSRILFIQNLLPLLAPSVSASHTHVISVYAAGLEGKLIPDDLSLRSPKNYGFHQARSHVVHMKTMAFEHLARQHQGLSLVHVYPGLVITPAFYASTMPWWFRLMWAIVGPALSRWCALPAAESAARTIYLANNRRFPPAGDGAETRKLGDEVALGTDGDRGSGAYAVADNSGALDVNAKYEELRKKGFGDEVWEHTMQAFEEIRAGKVFTA